MKIKSMTILNAAEVKIEYLDGTTDVKDGFELTERPEQDRFASFAVAHGYPDKNEIMRTLQRQDARGVRFTFTWPDTA